MYVILFIIVLFLIFSNTVTIETKKDRIDDLIKETEIYSGINPELYTDFITNIQFAKDNVKDIYIAYDHVLKALGYFNEIALYVVPIDPDVQDEITALNEKILLEFEKTFKKEANNQKLRFVPKYT
jgi:nucleoside-specific outer membrane channel protein Tsx|tara:strand:+ start:2282 stop:2659 length:378 start_codon:yes stop_codon:yes gene_type:complete